MKKIDFSFIALKKVAVNQDGIRQRSDRLSWERSFVVLQGDLIRIWKAGGILLVDQAALDEIKSDTSPIHEFNLRMTHIQKMSEQNCICFHFTHGMERLLISPEKVTERGVLEIWDEIFTRSIRQSIFLDQCSTSKYLQASQESNITTLVSSPDSEVFKDSFIVDCKWPGFKEYQILKLSVKMKPGWNDLRVVSKRCIALTREVSRKPVTCAVISPITSFHILSEVDQSIVLEGNGRFYLNDPKVAPFAERIIIKPAQPEDMSRLLVFLRDAFEIIFPHSNYLKPLQSKSITMRPIDSSNIDSDTKDFDFTTLVETKPWSQIIWKDLFNVYQERVIKNQKLGPKEFTKKLKSLGYCLKTSEGIVVNSATLNKMNEYEEAEFEAQIASMIWQHLTLIEGK